MLILNWAEGEAQVTWTSQPRDVTAQGERREVAGSGCPKPRLPVPSSALGHGAIHFSSASISPCGTDDTRGAGRAVYSLTIKL